jgi:hypothetical protein
MLAWGLHPFLACQREEKMRLIKQEFFDPLEVGSKSEALKQKKLRVKELRMQGYKVVSCILKNQLREYADLEIPDGRIRDVFMINIYEPY